MNREDRNSQWVLGFDGGCSTCLLIAERIVELSSGRIVARNLYASDVRSWRERALGVDAPWLPTLLRVEDDDRVQAWIGPAMALRLGQIIGVRAG